MRKCIRGNRASIDEIAFELDVLNDVLANSFCVLGKCESRDRFW